jgi:hypothetical protein
MPKKSVDTSFLGPPAIAVHNNCHMFGYFVWINQGHNVLFGDAGN